MSHCGRCAWPRPERERRRNDRFSGSSTQTRSTTRPVVVVVAVYLWLCATATAVAWIADTQPRKSSKFILAADTDVIGTCQVSSMGLRSSEQLSLRCCLQQMQSRPQQSVEDELDANTSYIRIIGATGCSSRMCFQLVVRHPYRHIPRMRWRYCRESS